MDPEADHRVIFAWQRGQAHAGFTLIEVLVAMTLMFLLAGSMSILVGAAIRSKLIIAVRSADTAAARQTLEWMSERLRNAGLNLRPSEQAILRCQDMVVAQDAALRPAASSVHVSGEILNTDAIAGNEVMTIGYQLGTDPTTGNQVVMEYTQPCISGAPSSLTTLSNPHVSVTAFTLEYFSDNGAQVTALTDVNQIRLIRGVRISLTVQGSQGSSGVQTQTWTTYVGLRNPEPHTNEWKNVNEDF